MITLSNPVSPEICRRIVAVAEQLFDQAGRKEMPRTAAVRRLAMAQKEDALEVLKCWRRAERLRSSQADNSVPEVGGNPFAALVAAKKMMRATQQEFLQAQAKWFVESAAIEARLDGVMSAFKSQEAELHAARARLCDIELKAAVSAIEAQREVADSQSRIQKLNERANHLKASLQTAQESANMLFMDIAEVGRVQNDLTAAVLDVAVGYPATESLPAESSNELTQVMATLPSAHKFKPDRADIV